VEGGLVNQLPENTIASLIFYRAWYFECILVVS